MSVALGWLLTSSSLVDVSLVDEDDVGDELHDELLVTSALYGVGQILHPDLCTDPSEDHSMLPAGNTPSKPFPSPS